MKKIEHSVHDFIQAIRVMDESIIAFGTREIAIFTNQDIAIFSQEVNKHLAYSGSKSYIVEVQENYIFLDFDNMNDTQKEQANEILKLRS